MARQKPAEEPPKGSPAWMSTYGDMVTLLLTFFIMLYAMSNTSTEKVKAIMVSLKSYTGSTGILGGGDSYVSDGILLGSGVLPLPDYDVIISDQILGTKDGGAEEAEKQEIKDIAEAVKDALEGKNKKTKYKR